MFGRPVPVERPDRPFTGFKLAQAVLSVDGQRAGFAGLSIGARSVYGVTAEAACVWNRRHTPPKRWCRCGFYCLSTLADARALSCATENRAAVLLEVVASGRFIRYERGLRYSQQRLRSAQVGSCTCGRRSVVLADDGRGFVGWRCLRPSCAPCSTDRAFLTVDQFAARLDEPIPVAADAGGDLPGTPGPARPVLGGAVLGGPGPSRPGQAGPDLGARGSGAGGLGAWQTGTRGLGAWQTGTRGLGAWRAGGPQPATPTPGQLIPGAPGHGLPGPGTPGPGAPAPGTPAPGMPVPGTAGAGMPVPGMPVPDEARPSAAIAVLAAEIALLQARLDDLQAQVNRHRGGPGPDS